MFRKYQTTPKNFKKEKFNLNQDQDQKKKRNFNLNSLFELNWKKVWSWGIPKFYLHSYFAVSLLSKPQ